jgi:hypothetical protein
MVYLASSISPDLIVSLRARVLEVMVVQTECLICRDAGMIFHLYIALLCLQ